jgi:hypothetical protein
VSSLYRDRFLEVEEGAAVAEAGFAVGAVSGSGALWRGLVGVNTEAFITADGHLVATVDRGSAGKTTGPADARHVLSALVRVRAFVRRCCRSAAYT